MSICPTGFLSWVPAIAFFVLLNLFIRGFLSYVCSLKSSSFGSSMMLSSVLPWVLPWVNPFLLLVSPSPSLFPCFCFFLAAHYFYYSLISCSLGSLMVPIRVLPFPIYIYIIIPAYVKHCSFSFPYSSILNSLASKRIIRSILPLPDLLKAYSMPHCISAYK